MDISEDERLSCLLWVIFWTSMHLSCLMRMIFWLKLSRKRIPMIIILTMSFNISMMSILGKAICMRKNLYLKWERVWWMWIEWFRQWQWRWSDVWWWSFGKWGWWSQPRRRWVGNDGQNGGATFLSYDRDVFHEFVEERNLVNDLIDIVNVNL